MRAKSKQPPGKMWRAAVALAVAASVISSPLNSAKAADDTRTFPETGKTVSGRFLEYWDDNGGLAQQGFPISEEMQEESVVDGKTYTVQYFERAVFERHPENAGPYDVLLSLLGSFYYQGKYNGSAPGQKASTTNPRKFAETGKTIGGVFRKYWEQHGGLAQQGYPISDEFQEKSTTDGKTYTVQYFERAVFERHPENAGQPSEVLLSLLGVSSFSSRYGGGTPPNAPLQPDISTTDIARKGWTNITAIGGNLLLFLNASNGDFATARVNDDGTITPLIRIAGAKPVQDTLVFGGVDNFFYVYNAKSGQASIFTVEDNGNLTVEASQQWQAGWTSISIDRETGLGLVYNQSNGQYITTKTEGDGKLSNLKVLAQPYTEHWLYFLPIGKGLWLFSKVIPGVGTSADVAKISEDGTFKSLYSIPNFPLFTNTVFDGAHILTYHKDDGTAYIIIDFTEDGADIKVLKALNKWSPGWVQVVATKNGVITFYDPKAGKLMTARIEDDGNINKLKTYQP